MRKSVVLAAEDRPDAVQRRRDRRIRRIKSGCIVDGGRCGAI
jgi:hypothetical protein